MAATYTIRQLRELVTPVAIRHGVKRVAVFGSYGRGQATEKSDVDLYIEKGRMRTLLNVIAFQLDVEETLGIPVDIATNDTNDPSFLARIKSDEVTLYER